MYRVDTPTSVSVYGGFGPAGTPGHFSSGNPTVGQRGTIPGCDWFEGVQEELMSIVTAGRLTPQKGNTHQLVQSILSMQLMIDNGSGGANALICAPVVPFDNLNTNTIIWVLPAASNTGAATLNLGIGGNVAIVRPDQSPLQPGDYVGGWPFPAAYLGGHWVMLARRVKSQLGGPATLTVQAQTGNDATGSLTNPFQTLQAVWNWMVANLDAAQQTVTINCFGNFAAGLSAAVAVAGTNHGGLIFNFAAGATIAATTDCIVAQTGGVGFTIKGNATLSSSGGSSLRVFDGATVAFQDINFGPCNVNHIAISEGARVTPLAGYSISGGAQAHMSAYDTGKLRGASTVPIPVSLAGTPNFSAAFAVASDLGLLGLTNPAFSFSGAATGQRYSVGANGVIDTGGAGASFLPGNAPGPTTPTPTGGQYV